MSVGEERAAQEIVIIRRRGPAEEEHGSHGLWKIAYADFMTALMAFFLVMWLVNAANKKTLQQVATYFNPTRMSDQITREKGVHELAGSLESSDGAERDKKQGKAGGTSSSDDSKQLDVDEQSTFKDPYGLLSKIASKATTFRRGEDDVPQGGSRNAANETFSGGEGYRDPFDPNYRHDVAKADTAPEQVEITDGDAARAAVEPHDGQIEGPPRGEAAKGAEDRPDAPTTAEPQAATRAVDTQALDAVKEPPSQAADAVRPVEPAAAGRVTAPDAKSEPRPAGQVDAPQSAAAKAEQASAIGEGAGAKAAELALTEAAAKDLQNAVKAMVEKAQTVVPDIEVAATPEGVLVSLMDDARFGMFGVGSAKPRPELVAVMEKIGGLLRKSGGPIVVRGHTDGRPYRSEVYDNWRLSTARAHMAYYMLVRAGLPEARFERVEGYADRKLKVPADPGAAQNRRIEILIRRTAS